MYGDSLIVEFEDSEEDLEERMRRLLDHFHGVKDVKFNRVYEQAPLE